MEDIYIFLVKFNLPPIFTMLDVLKVDCGLLLLQLFGVSGIVLVGLSSWGSWSSILVCRILLSFGGGSLMGVVT